MSWALGIFEKHLTNKDSYRLLQGFEQEYLTSVIMYYNMTPNLNLYR